MTIQRSRSQLLMLFGVALLISFGSGVSQAQWTTTGAGNTGDAYNTNSSGNVGIGTSSPVQKLEVAGNVSLGGAGFGRYFYAYYNSSSNYAGMTATSGGILQFFTGLSSPSARMSIDTVGNVGIGTQSPTAKLHVYGGSGSSRLLVLGEGAGTGLRNLSLGYDYNSDYSWLQSIHDGTAYTPLALQTAGGNVGIGTTIPVRKLEVAGIIRATASEAVGDGSDTIGAGPYRAWYNSAVTRGWAQQLSANNNLDFWFYDGNWVQKATIDGSGNLSVSGNIAAKYQDVAEWVPSSEQLAAGTVVVLDATKSNQVISSSVSYDTRVAGVVSAQPGITLGEKSEGEVIVATTGRVRVKVDASKGPIKIGDLLVTSDVPGVAMKSEAVNLGGVQIHRPGTLIGKALEPWEKGKGEILVLLSLQ